MNRSKEARSIREDLTDEQLRAAITAWGKACEESRYIEHIDLADEIRNRLLGEKWRRERAVEERRQMSE